MTARVKRWTGTLNNWQEESLKTLLALHSTDILTYLVIGKEVGQEGTPHLQAYWEVKKRVSFMKMKKLLTTPGWHIEAAKGTAAQNVIYCSKEDGQAMVLGQPMAQGSRTDLLAMKEDILSGMGIHELAQKHFSAYLRYRSSILAFYALQRRETELKYQLEDFPVQWRLEMQQKSLIIWGPPGIGKTELAKALLGENYLFVSHMDQLTQYDKSFHSGILFDDMSFLQIHREAQIAITDWDNERAIHVRYQLALIPAATRKIFTTNIEGGRIFDLDDGAIMRRLQICHVSDRLE